MPRRPLKELTIELQGGLGNQLFQYQFGNYLNLSKNRDVVLNTSKLSRTNQTHMGANITTLNLALRSNSEDEKFFSRIVFRILNSLRQRSLLPKRLHIRHSPTFFAKEIGFDRELESELSQNRKLKRINGYFQSWRYGENQKSKIEDLFEQISIKNLYLQSLEFNFRRKDVIAIHIRLGDYKLKANSYIGLLSQDYYRTCVNYLLSNQVKCQIYIFSDEIDLAKEIFANVFPEGTIWVKPELNHDPLEILKLMSLAKIFVISNSTFSWWAANMSANPDFVLAPSKWFRLARDPQDLCPPNWIRISSDWQDFEN